MSRKPVFRIVKRPAEERYVIERLGLFGWKHVEFFYNRAKADEYVAEAESNPTGVVYHTAAQ